MRIRSSYVHKWMTAGATLAAATLAACSEAPDDATGDVGQEVARVDLERAGRREDGAQQLRQLIDKQVGGLEKLQVPARDAAIPVPRQADGTVNPRYETTEAKRFLGKMLFHDPVRTARIDPTFGGLPATAQTGSCGSCHLGEAAGKAGAVLNFNVGGEGRGYTDEHGAFVVRRRARADIPVVRQTRLFPGDTLVDALPTLTDIYLVPPLPGRIEVATPARGSKLPAPLQLLATGRLDGVDSVGRQSPSMIGAAFNNRLLLGGFAGESNDAPGGLNPFGDPAQENLTLLLLDAHRMLDAEAAKLREIAAFVKLFRDAFPQEAAKADASHDINELINDQTVLRATATFLRATVTRNTPFDRFLAGDNRALTERQLRGARLFFTPATDPARGAGCVSCHSGPMLNKQQNDPDVAGIGQFVEENFVNVGIGDHPLQALARAARKDAAFHDEGRKEITRRDEDAFKFRVVTLRQLKDARTFFHSGSFTNVRDVVRYFNAGVPQDAAAGSAGTLSTLFTHPRGPGAPRGLGLREDEIDALTDFLENALYDRAFVEYDPTSTTQTFQPNARDLTYSKYRPDLAALGAVDGQMLSGKAIDNDDALSRRDQGLEFLDVTAQVGVTRIESRGERRRQVDTYRLTNRSGSVVDTHLLVLAQGLPDGARVRNADGASRAGDPYRRLFLNGGVLLPGQSTVATFVIERAPRRRDARHRDDDRDDAPMNYTLKLLSGQGQP
jgi:cytochrome c peroxidase